ncbi:hypothetical protein LshimejAT787_1700940 [Lyophyllum shimeji]|uniref:Uncharacterized protein n=1 Tax=Lyophyllum shimeji TaxID=47721 RepID=A0A9P3PWV2_LYOSH|nr:hypothetical protein LshimejAT787_1700940 [Lyophyllum shimeji]
MAKSPPPAMPIDFRGAKGVHIRNSRISDIAGNYNVQNNCSHKVNCGNITTNITARSNNDSSTKIGRTATPEHIVVRS